MVLELLLEPVLAQDVDEPDKVDLAARLLGAPAAAARRGRALHLLFVQLLLRDRVEDAHLVGIGVGVGVGVGVRARGRGRARVGARVRVRG